MNQPVQSKDESIQAILEALKANRPLRAEEACRDYLHAHPGNVDHMRLLGNILVKQNRLAEAEENIRFALELRPRYPQMHEDLGHILMLQRRFEEAIPCLEKAIELEPNLPQAHKKLGRALAAVGRGDDADLAFIEFFERDEDSGEVATGADHLKAGRLDEAIEILQGVLRKNPDNVDAMMFLSMSYRQKEENIDDAEALVRRATQVAPDHISAWLNLGTILLEKNQRPEAIEAFEKAIKLDGAHPGAWALLANAYGVSAFPEKAVHAYAKSLQFQPENANAQMGYGHVLKTVGDQEGSLKAYREAIRLNPRFGEVYWSMANLKIFKFQESEVEAMLEQLDNGQLNDSEEVHVRFALGKAMEDMGNYDRAWHYYDTGNQKQRESVYHDPAETEERQSNIREVFNEEFFRDKEGAGLDAADPILIVGMPRSGSTLIEQILASHSQVEGTAELPELGRISALLGRYRPHDEQFPQAAREVRTRDWAALGSQYIRDTRQYRETDKPFFTDKLPNNFPLVGFLHLALPNAKVINTYRHPLDSLLGNYKQLYGKGQNFTYDTLDLAEYYKSYYKTMQHWDEVLPGKVLHVHYEDTVLDLEGQVRRILDYLGLPFEEQCLRFWETDRSVKTASSEQVRQPIYTGALGKWRRYDEHLDYWQESLEDIIDELPERVRNAGL